MDDEKETAESPREKGNKLYKENKLSEAIRAYQASYEMDKTDARPLANMSAALYEAGKYEHSAKLAKAAIRSYKKVEDRSAVKAKLQALTSRLGKIGINSHSKSEDSVTLTKLMKLPRYLGNMTERMDYWVLGHDTCKSLYDTEILEDASRDDGPIALFFAGISDARNLYATIIHMAELKEKNQLPVDQKKHFTINDIKASVLARNLLICMLVQDLIDLGREDKLQREQHMCTIFYVFASRLMPKSVWNHLQTLIERALISLENGFSPLSWFHIHKPNIEEVVQAMHFWQAEVVDYCPAERIVEMIFRELAGKREAMRNNDNHEILKHGLYRILKSLEMENLIHVNSGLLMPPQSVLKRENIELQRLLEEFSVDNVDEPAARLRSMLPLLWKINPTACDWINEKRRWNHVTEQQYPSEKRVIKDEYCDDPFSLPLDLIQFTGLSAPDDPTHLYHWIEMFFDKLSDAIAEIDGQFIIEAIRGDCGKIFDRLRHNTLAVRCDGDVAAPVLFDRIHLSNIPDYNGGHFVTFLHAIPLLRPGSSKLISHSLRDADWWESLEHRDANYMGISSQEMLLKLFGVRITEYPRGRFRYSLGNYYGYVSVLKGRMGYGHLIPKQDLQHWLYALLFRLLMPRSRPSSKRTETKQPTMASNNFKPLNMAIFIRILIRLHEIGYPAHWLSEVLTSILRNNIVSTARPPRSHRETIEEVKKQHQPKKLSTAICLTEMKLLYTLFSPILPFSLDTANLNCPTPERIRRYEITLEAVATKASSNVYVLCFFDDERMADIWQLDHPSEHLAELIDSTSEEIDAVYGEKTITELREKGLHWITMFEWSPSRMTASVWLDEDFVNNVLIAKGLSCGLVRNDYWITASDAKIVNGNLRAGLRWVDWQGESL